MIIKKIGFILKKIITAVKLLLIIVPVLLIIDKINGGKYLYPHIVEFIKPAAPSASSETPETTPNKDLFPSPETSEQPTVSVSTREIHLGSLPNPDIAQHTGNFHTASFWKNAAPYNIIAELQKGADINARNQNGQTALMYAAGIADNPRIIDTLFTYGASPSSRDSAGRTALMIAAGLNPNPDIVNRLISCGANIHDKDRQGWTPLHYAAARSSETSVILALLQHGADINAPVTPEEAPWKHASLDNQFLEITKIALKNAKHFITAAYLSLGSETNVDFTEILSEQLDEMAAEINSPDAGKTPLMLAAQNGTPEVAAYLMQHGANILLRDSKGKTAVDYAKENPRLYKTETYWKMNDKLYN